MNYKVNKFRKILVAMVSMAALAGLLSCEKYTYTPPVVNPDEPIYFQAEIQPIFSSNCISCHGGAKSPDLRDGKSYAALTKGSYINLPAETSKLYKTMAGASHASRSTETEKLKVFVWINQGALNN